MNKKKNNNALFDKEHNNKKSLRELAEFIARCMKKERKNVQHKDKVKRPRTTYPRKKQQ